MSIVQSRGFFLASFIALSVTFSGSTVVQAQSKSLPMQKSCDAVFNQSLKVYDALEWTSKWIDEITRIERAGASANLAQQSLYRDARANYTKEVRKVIRALDNASRLAKNKTNRLLLRQAASDARAMREPVQTSYNAGFNQVWDALDQVYTNMDYGKC